MWKGADFYGVCHRDYLLLMGVDRGVNVPENCSWENSRKLRVKEKVFRAKLFILCYFNLRLDVLRLQCRLTFIYHIIRNFIYHVARLGNVLFSKIFTSISISNRDFSTQYLYVNSIFKYYRSNNLGKQKLNRCSSYHTSD